MLDDSSPFLALPLAHVQRDLLKLYERVARQTGRVEILGPGGERACVLISKAELDSLERALEVLSDAPAVREMTAELAQLAQCAEPIPA
jgi:PHD/YefM family antitoxin component YafN of YafNO toxin-antitoxin module